MTPASPKQRALFFALAHELGYDAATIKQRAKQHFGLASFNDLTTQQLGELIDRLLTLQARRERTSTPEHTAGWITGQHCCSACRMSWRGV